MNILTGVFDGKFTAVDWGLVGVSTYWMIIDLIVIIMGAAEIYSVRLKKRG